MRKILLTLLAAGAMLAAIPAASIAMGGDHHQGDRHREREHRREHRAGHHHHHHFRIRHERFRTSAGDHARGAAGTVTAFAGGRLTIRLADGASVSGAVNRFTEVECELRGDRNGRGGDRGDDGPRHDAGGDRGDDGPRHDAGGDRGDDGPRHDAGGDRGDDGPRHDAGDDRGRDNSDHHDANRRHRCTTIALGSTVRDATLTLSRSGAVWTRVDLIDS